MKHTTLLFSLAPVFTSQVLAWSWPSSSFSSRADLSTRKASILIDPGAQPSLPSAKEVVAADVLPIDNIQGDILIGMKKKRELFWFFKINDAAAFKTALHDNIVPLITTTTQLLPGSTQPDTAANIALSARGLSTLGLTDSLSDSAFLEGQIPAAAARFHDRPAEWVTAFTGSDVDGVLLLASNDDANIVSQLSSIQTSLGASAAEVYRLQGAARPGAEEGHEHFGFMDGISQPHVDGFGTQLPGQKTIPPGQILLGETGDSTQRPAWAKDGSFLAFRQLKQLVPEFDKFLLDNPTTIDSMTPEEGSVFTGARMVGRWKSGAPLALSPLVDDPVLAADQNRNNDFHFNELDDFNRCPFSAHIRKTNPRADLGDTDSFHIVRAGIPYGPEVSDEERASNTSSTQNERGLAFVSYQSSIESGFAFIQQQWANNPGFLRSGVGIDPIIGTNGGSPFDITDVNPRSPTTPLTIIQDFVISRGGEYFFSPSISALRDVISV